MARIGQPAHAVIAGLYGAALTAAGPLLRVRLAWRARREPLYGERVNERFGRYDPAALEELARWRAAPGPRVWLHAVSLGETRAAAPLVAALRDRRPGIRFLWTHGTATGREAGRQMLGPGDLQLWQPFDSPGAVRRFLEAGAPTLGLLMETEIWPGLLSEARRRALPVILANARLSERSRARGQRLSALLRPAVAGLHAVLAQTPEDAARLVSAGAPPDRVQVAGNLKFDVTPAPEQLALGRLWKRVLGRPVVMIASSREGEEAALLAAWQARRGSASPGQGPLLLIVPRHPQRFGEVAALAASAGFTVARRSTFGEAMPSRSVLQADVWVGDSLGEMPAYYALADAALLGGSFEPLGGQNLIEAAACGCPVVMGPHTFNFSDAAARAEATGAALRVESIDAAVQRVRFDLGTATIAARGQAGLDFAACHRGAAERMALAVLAALPAAEERRLSSAPAGR